MTPITVTSSFVIFPGSFSVILASIRQTSPSYGLTSVQVTSAGPFWIVSTYPRRS